MSRMRTINQTMEYLRSKDPDTALTEWWVRQNLRNGSIKHHKAGNRYIIDLDSLEEYLKNPTIQNEDLDYTNSIKTRKVR